MKIFSIIPARGGSKRLPGKNIKLFCGKPLIHYTIEKCLMFSDEVWVSSDDEKILEISRQYKSIHTLKRPKDISQDDSTPNEYMEHFFDNVKIEDDDIVVLCQPTSPLVSEDYYVKGIKFLKKHKRYDIVVSVFEDKRRCYDNYGELLLENEWRYEENGAFYVFFKKNYLKNDCEIGEKVHTILVPKILSVDIDTKEDFNLAEMIYEKYIKKFNP